MGRCRAEWEVACSQFLLPAPDALPPETRVLHEMGGHHPKAPWWDLDVRAKGADAPQRRDMPRRPKRAAFPDVVFDFMFLLAGRAGGWGRFGAASGGDRPNRPVPLGHDSAINGVGGWGRTWITVASLLSSRILMYDLSPAFGHFSSC